MTGIAVLAATASPTDQDPVNRTLARVPVQVALGLAAVSEFVADKLPQAPSRLSVAGLPGRLVLGAVCGVAVAGRHSGSTPIAPTDGPARLRDPKLRSVLYGAVGMGAALAGSWLGVRWRGLAAPRPKRQRKRAIAAALAEDISVLGLATTGARS